MNTYLTSLKTLIADEQGAVLVEYGLLISLIAIACLAALTALGGGIKALFTTVASDL